MTRILTLHDPEQLDRIDSRNRRDKLRRRDVRRARRDTWEA